MLKNNSMRTKIVFTGFAPNVTLKDIGISLSYMLPWKWGGLSEGNNTAQCEKLIGEYFGENRKAVMFDSGRSALYAALTALGVGEGDEVIVQAFTCVVVINAITRTGAKPVYVDIDETYNIDPHVLEQKINSKTKIIIVQHTFGTPAQIELIKNVAQTHGLRIVEDCAHALGARHNNKLLGAFGDIAMLSFSTDKVISCVRGGAILTNDHELYKACANLQKSLPIVPKREVLRHLLYFPLFFIGRLTYGIGIGKIFLFMVKKIGLTSRIIEDAEKEGEWPPLYPAQFPNALGEMLIHQLGEVDFINRKRVEIANIYTKKINNKAIIKPNRNDESIYLRYAIQVQDPRACARKAKQKGIILGDWYQTIVAPQDVHMARMNYTLGSCPKAEYAAQHVLNLPTDRHTGADDIQRIIDFCNTYVGG